MRVPISLKEEVREFLETKGYRIPVFLSGTPAEPSTEPNECIGEHTKLRDLFPHPKNMGLAFARGDSMVKIGMFDGDALFFDRQQPPRHRDIVIAMIDRKQIVKRLHVANGKCTLMPESDNHQPLAIVEGADFKITGVVKVWLRKP